MGVPRTLHLDQDELAEYLADPDLFAAEYLGLTIDQYREWIALEGAALCGERTKAGHPCRSVVKYCDDPAEWLELHRSVACVNHGGEKYRKGRRGQWPPGMWELVPIERNSYLRSSSIAAANWSKVEKLLAARR